MNMDARPEKINPTPQQLQDIEIRATGLGRGDIVHRIDNDLGTLRLIMHMATKKGWTDDLRKNWDEKVSQINIDIAQVKMAKAEAEAKERGLL